MLQLRLDELFTPELLKAFRERWGVSPDAADRVALRIVKMFELQEPGTDKIVSRRRKDAWLKLIINALIGPEPDFEAWIEALAKGNFEIRPNALYGRAEKGKGQPAMVLQRQRQLIEGLTAKEKLSPAEREERHLVYTDALRQILVSVLLRELKEACSVKAAVGPAWPMVKAVDHLTEQELSQLRYFGADPAFQRHLAKTFREALVAWIENCHGGQAPTIPNVYFEKGLPPGTTKQDALKHLDRDIVAIEGYRARLSQALELDPALPIRAMTGANLEEIVEEDGATIRSALTLVDAGPYRFFTEANGGDERFEYNEKSRASLNASLPLLTCAGSHQQHEAARQRALRRASLRQTRPGRMLDHHLQEEIAAYAAEGLPPPKDLTPEHAIFFEEEVCRVYHERFHDDERWEQLGFVFPVAFPC